MDAKRRLSSILSLKKYLEVGIEAIERGEVSDLDRVIEQSFYENGWFSKPEVLKSLSYWRDKLNESEVVNWLNAYRFSGKSKKVLVITAGNIPLVGLHDVLSVLLSGHDVLVKPSSNDKVLLNHLLEVLMDVEPAWSAHIDVLSEPGSDFDAVIATGSDNTARYFERYFSKVPNILRKNRNSVAIVEQGVTDDELKLLGRDVFDYFGLGCRNVSKVFIPRGFNTDRLFESFTSYSSVIDNKKYANNYMYYRTIYMMNKVDFLENGFFILKEDESLHSPVSVLHFEYYDDLNKVKQDVMNLGEQLQCVVGAGFEEFGLSQKPELNTYADNVDTLQFLASIE